MEVDICHALVVNIRVDGVHVRSNERAIIRPRLPGGLLYGPCSARIPQAPVQQVSKQINPSPIKYCTCDPRSGRVKCRCQYGTGKHPPPGLSYRESATLRSVAQRDMMAFEAKSLFLYFPRT
jgi:hypothetical protein